LNLYNHHMPKGEKGTARPYLRGKIWWIKFYVDGKPVYESTNTENKSEAVKILNRKRRDADEGKVTANACTVGHLLDLLVKQQCRMQRADVDKVKSRIKNHLRPQLGNVLLSRFTEDDVERYIDARLDEDAAPATINREVAALKTALKIGRRKHLLNHVVEWDKLPELNIREGFLDYDDYRMLLSELPDELKLLLVLGYHYGIRKGELLKYRWDHVSWFARELRIPQPDTKNKEPKIVPFYGDVEHRLVIEKRQRDASYADSPWMFSRVGKAIKDFRASWADAVERAGLKDSIGLFHDLRRSAARNMVNAGMDEKLAMKIGGWKTDSVFRRYRITPRRDLQRAAEKMNEFFKQERAELQKIVTKEVTTTSLTVAKERIQ
jgi:integrase